MMASNHRGDNMRRRNSGFSPSNTRDSAFFNLGVSKGKKNSPQALSKLPKDLKCSKKEQRYFRNKNFLKKETQDSAIASRPNFGGSDTPVVTPKESVEEDLSLFGVSPIKQNARAAKTLKSLLCPNSDLFKEATPNKRVAKSNDKISSKINERQGPTMGCNDADTLKPHAASAFSGKKVSQTGRIVTVSTGRPKSVEHQEQTAFPANGLSKAKKAFSSRGLSKARKLGKRPVSTELPRKVVFDGKDSITKKRRKSEPMTCSFGDPITRPCDGAEAKRCNLLPTLSPFKQNIHESPRRCSISLGYTGCLGGLSASQAEVDHKVNEQISRPKVSDHDGTGGKHRGRQLTVPSPGSYSSVSNGSLPIVSAYSSDDQPEEDEDSLNNPLRCKRLKTLLPLATGRKSNRNNKNAKNHLISTKARHSCRAHSWLLEDDYTFRLRGYDGPLGQSEWGKAFLRRYENFVIAGECQEIEFGADWDSAIAAVSAAYQKFLLDNPEVAKEAEEDAIEEARERRKQVKDMNQKEEQEKYNRRVEESQAMMYPTPNISKVADSSPDMKYALIFSESEPSQLGAASTKAARRSRDENKPVDTPGWEPFDLDTHMAEVNGAEQCSEKHKKLRKEHHNLLELTRNLAYLRKHEARF